MSEEETMMHVLGVDIIQKNSLAKGLKKFGIRGEKSVTKELTQLNDMQPYFPLDPNNLTKEQQAEAIGSLMFLVDKLNGYINARGCADDRKQSRREVYKK